METLKGLENSWEYDSVPPSGGSLEIGNFEKVMKVGSTGQTVPPSGGSLEIGNVEVALPQSLEPQVPPSGGSLEIGN